MNNLRVVTFPNVVLFSVPLFILLMVVERVSYLLHRDDEELGYGAKDTATSLSMGLGSLGWDVDRNFGGIFIIWDRLFGSFAPETERVLYGLTKNLNTFNPLRVAYHEYASIARDIRNARWRDKFGYLFTSPAGQGRRPCSTRVAKRFKVRVKASFEPGQSKGHANRPARPPGR